MKITIKRIKEQYRETPLWIATVVIDGKREEFASKTLEGVLHTLQSETGIFTDKKEA